jgi:ribosome-associated protein
MLDVNDRIQIPDEEFTWSFVRSGGPGGQNVNKVASKAVLRWSLAQSSSLPADVKARLQEQQRHRITSEGDFLLTSQRYRDRERNRQDCLEKLRAFVLQATIVPKVRKKKKPTRASRERRLEMKRHRAATKSSRRAPAGD